jgi:hypothetical protein
MPDTATQPTSRAEQGSRPEWLAAERRSVRHVNEINMNPDAIREKSGDDYIADDRTFVMGIDQRFAAHMAERFR